MRRDDFGTRERQLAHLSEAHCGFGLEQSAQILFLRSSLLMSSWRVFFATAWSIGCGWDGKLELKGSTWNGHHFYQLLF